MATQSRKGVTENMRRLNVKLHHIRVKSQEQSNQDKIPKYTCQNDKV